MTLKDLTPAHARRWVEQEMPKQTTVPEIERRILSERAILKASSDALPNSRWAHNELARLLVARLSEMTPK
jgi:hypothetical protein